MKKKTNLNATLIALVIIAVVLTAFFALPHGQSEGTITVFGIKLKFKGNNQSIAQPGVHVKDASADGSIHITDTTGKGVQGEKLKAGGDIDVTSSSTNSPPK